MTTGAFDDLQLLIFDLDGTLIDSKEDLALSVNLTRAEMGLGPLAADVVASYVGQGVTTLIRRALGNGARGEVRQEDVEKGISIFLETYRAHMLDNTVAYPGVRVALEELQGHVLAVLTNKPVDFSRGILVGLGIAQHFAYVYGGNSFDEKKPDPAGVFRLMSDTGATARQTMIVGDSDTDVLTGRNAGVWTCGVTYGIGRHTLDATPPDVLVNDLRELVPLVMNGFKSRD